MTARRYVLALDQGTSGSTALVVDVEGRVLSRGHAELSQHYPQPGWVEHDPDQIWDTVCRAAIQALGAARVAGAEVAAVGITNQRETTLVWERASGAPIHRAIVWQCRRTAAACDRLRAEGGEPVVRERTGLVLDAYFSGTKLRLAARRRPWRSPARRARRARLRHRRQLARLEAHRRPRSHDGRHQRLAHPCSQPATRSRGTTRCCRILGVPRAVFPTWWRHRADRGDRGPRVAAAGRADCRASPVTSKRPSSDRPASARATRRTRTGPGCFVLLNTGPTPVPSAHGLAHHGRLAHRRRRRRTHSRGASSSRVRPSSGCATGSGLVKEAAETQALAASVPDTGGVYFVPAFVGLGAPYWDMYARGTIVGLTRGTTRAHLVRAALEAIAWQSRDVLEAMAADARRPPLRAARRRRRRRQRFPVSVPGRRAGR